MDYWVSPKYRQSKLASGLLVDKIDVFEDQWKGWILEHAECLLSATCPGRNHSGLAVLMIVTSYFEAIACFLRGERSDHKSPEFFSFGFSQVFPIEADRLRKGGVQDPDLAVKNIKCALYSEVRCGLFHEAMIRGLVVINTSSNAPFEYTVTKDTAATGQILVNPMLVLWGVMGHFSGYVKRLRDPAEIELRRNFECFWDVRPLPPPKRADRKSG